MKAFLLLLYILSPPLEICLVQLQTSNFQTKIPPKIITTSDVHI